MNLKEGVESIQGFEFPGPVRPEIIQIGDREERSNRKCRRVENGIKKEVIPRPQKRETTE